MSASEPTLQELGWDHFFQQQLSLKEWETTVPARVFAAQGNTVDIVGVDRRELVSLPGRWKALSPEERPTVGDWLLLGDDGQPARLLRRKSVFKRNAAGQDARVQLLAANVDILFIVTSCNHDFNPSRLERYLALALEAGAEPVLLLTKVDLIDAANIEEFIAAAQNLRRDLIIETVNSKDPATVEGLRRWCTKGKTVALVGSSGVGKSTLINTLHAQEIQETGAIRDEDSKGRHTTTARTLHLLPDGGLLLDSPGMRELQLFDCETGIAALFEEIEKIACNCRFSDCSHRDEPGCAVLAAAESGELDERRLGNYMKLLAEQKRTSETLVEKRRREKDFSKFCKKVMADKKSKHKRY